jgi:hypothetical protein
VFTEKISFHKHKYYLLMVVNLFFICSFSIISYSNDISVAFADSTEFNVIAVGDWDCNSNSESTIISILNYKPELILSLGDNSYQSTGDCWLDQIQPIQSLMKIVLGNKDKSESLSNQYMEEFDLQSQYYSFDYENIHFLALSTIIPYDTDSEQYKFAENDLKTAKSNPKIKWIISFLHNPLYTSPSSYVKMKSKLIEVLHPLFENNKVDLAIQAHTHNYQRTFPLMFNKDDPLYPIITENNLTSSNTPNGIIFLIVGTGGAKLHKLTDSNPFTMFQQDEQFGFLNLNFLEDGKTLFGEFIGNNGSKIDSFKITKP